MFATKFFWDWIDAAFVPWVTLRQSFYGQIGTTQGTEPFDGGDCVA
jgi:hypothetical protein